jgi:transposase
VPDRKALAGILFVLRTGIPWEHLPQRFGCGSGMTCWRRLREWQRAGVWQKIRVALEEGMGATEGIDWARAWIRAARVRPGRRVARRVLAPATGLGRTAPRYEPTEVGRRMWDPGRSEPA